MKQIKIGIMLVIAFSLLSSSCKENKNMAEADKDKMDTPKPVEPKTQSVIVDPAYSNAKTDDFSLLESSINGDILRLLVQYGGGCETHNWALKTNGAYAKSLPPQITLNLEHNSNNDMCRALVRDTLEFNISPIKYPGSFEVVVKIFNFEKQSVRYRYN